MNNKYEHICLLVLSLAISVACFFFDSLESKQVYSAWLTLVLASYHLYRVARSTMLFLLLFFIWMFPFDYLLIYFSGVPFYPFYRLEFIGETFLTVNIFYSCMFLLPKPRSSVLYSKFQFIDSRITFWFVWLIFLLITLYLKGSNIFSQESSYATYQENLGSASGLNEYVIMLGIFLFFCKRNRFMNIAYILILGLYIIKSILFGFRVQSMMVMLLLFYAFIGKDLKRHTNCLIAVSGFLFMLAFGFLKEGESIDGFSLRWFVDDRYGYAQSHQQGVLSSSTIMRYHIDKFEEVSSFQVSGALLAATVPRRLIGDYVLWAYPSVFVKKYEYTPGGGIFTMQIRLLLGWFGLFSLTLILVQTFKNISKPKTRTGFSKVLTIFSVSLMVFFPRWVSYDFFSFGLRTCLIVVVLYGIYKLINLLSKKSNNEV